MTAIHHTDGSNRSVMDAFRALPGVVYRSDAVWSPRSESAIDDCLEDAASGAVALRAVVAGEAGHPRARAMAVLDRGASSIGPLEGWVGLFECVPGWEGAGVEVLLTCENWLRQHGVARLVAPRVDALRSGLLMDGFDLPHTIFTAHNPAFYAGVFADAGYSVHSRMYGYTYSRDRVPSLPQVRPDGITVRHPDLTRPEEELERLEPLQAEVFGGVVGHVTRDRAGSGRLLRRLLPIMDPDLVEIAEDESGQVVGLLICLPDVWQHERPIDRARWISVAVAPAWRRRGVGIAMGLDVLGQLLSKGYQTLDGSWVREDNERAHSLVALLGGRRGRSFALLVKEL